MYVLMYPCFIKNPLTWSWWQTHLYQMGVSHQGHMLLGDTVLCLWEIKWSVPWFDCDESLTCRGLNSNSRHFNGFTFIFVSCGESRLLISWCVGDMCDMAGSDEDHGRSRRPGAEDRGWSHRTILGGRTIERSNDAVCSVNRAWGDEECRFLGWASKPRVTVYQWFNFKTTGSGFLVWASKPIATVWWFGHQNNRDSFFVWTSKLSGVWFVGCATKSTWGNAGHASRCSGLLRKKVSWARVS
jgi:hypothetical protein